MRDHSGDKYRHIILDGVTETERFRRPLQRIEPSQIPARNRQQHGNFLLGQLNALQSTMEHARQLQEMAGLEGGFGLQVEFESFPDIELAFESLARERGGIELLNVRHDAGKTLATVFVPDGKLQHFENLLRDYLAERRDRAGRARDHQRLVNAIEQIRAATLRALWTDDLSVFPVDDKEVFWWEVWLPVGPDRQATVADFRRLAGGMDLGVAPGELRFPERTVLLVRASGGQMRRSMLALNCVAELRRAKETAEFFDSLPPVEQPEWLDELLARSSFPGMNEDVPHVCLLDTGVNNRHLLLAPALSDADLHTVEPAWGFNDLCGHGTAIAGLALAGDLTRILETDATVEIGHRLESVKLLPEDGANAGDDRHHGYLTTEAVSRPEVTDPYRKRAFCLTVTARDYRDRGRPSAWSAAIDRLASDAEESNASPRLLIVSAGNVDDPNAWREYPQSNSTDGIHDPGQAWNALTVGAYTELDRIEEADAEAYRPIAPQGGLSPFSTTSQCWQPPIWPIKPDVVFEGGNAAKDALGAVWMPSLSLLTTNHEPHQRLFTTANATSAATALAARMAAQLMAAYPELWPETIRALMVHSAQWTEAMQRMFLPPNGKARKKDYADLVRHCGFGVPNLDAALWSVANSLSMVVQESLQPFVRESPKDPTLRDMHLHRLPWPLEELEALQETPVEMRVTLSYFIEPNPSERGFRSRYRYESHGLRFDVKRPHESEGAFRGRINAMARGEETGTPVGGDDPAWVIGPKNRHRGSIHSDIWQGKAADLASRGVLAVYPTVGWWKTRTRHERYNMATRYALIISIRAPEAKVDLYSAVVNKIAAPVTIGVS
ncbi:S8 family peptidase [Desulfurivibrio sp. D14AmB]|uniref:S8 family peptidase n=1 Tax=Desulfurivibrio sp. D14AmB TaxID=3374370 RepID=UPI00376EBB59